MSDFIEKTIGTLSNLFGNVPRNIDQNSTFRCLQSLSRTEFQSKLKSISSKQEEEAIVNHFLQEVEKELATPNISDSEVENCIHLAMCCESLGYKAPFAYVHAIKLAQKGNLNQKNTGYLAASAFLHPEHELVILLVNCIQKDLESHDYNEVMLGLKAVCNLISADSVHNVIYLVQEKLRHDKAEVRKLALLALNHCLRVTASESAYSIALPKLVKVLADPDLNVVSVAVAVIYNVIKNKPDNYEYLLESLETLQNQLLQRHCPKEMMYRGIPAPFLQIMVLKLFSVLCTTQEKTSKILPLLRLTLQKAEVNQNISYAIIAEVINTTVGITDDREMIQMALSSSSKFLKSNSVNLKYIGVHSISQIMQKLKPVLDMTHQENIMTCLKHPDCTLRTKTLELLYNLANPSNAQAVCKKLLEHINDKTDDYWRKDIGTKVLLIAYQYNTDDKWYLDVVNQVLLQIPEGISETDICRIISTINEDKNKGLQNYAKETYVKMCQNIVPPACVVKIIASIFEDSKELELLFPKLLSEIDETSLMWLMILLRNRLLTSGHLSEDVRKILVERKVVSKALQQVISEILKLAANEHIIQLKPLTSEIDLTLSFLDDYVCQSLDNGSSCYKPSRLRSLEFTQEVKNTSFVLASSGSSSSQKNFDYPMTSILNQISPSYYSLSSSSLSTLSQNVPSTMKPKKTVWTKEGRVKETKQILTKEDNPSITKDNLFAGLQ